jgi:hypothetical protein
MIRHGRRIGAFVSALFLTLFALCMEFVPSTMTASAKSVLSGPATVACSHVRFVGVMGSGENDDKHAITDYGMGGVVSQVVAPFSKEMEDKGIAVSPEGVKYDAVPIWQFLSMQASVDGGVQTLTNILNANKEDCVVLAGYSQGAWVIHDALDDTLHNLPLSARLRVKAVLAFGDPWFDPKERGAIRYGAVPKLVRSASEQKRLYEELEASGGLRGVKDFPSWVFAVRSYCKRYDPICSVSQARGLTGGLANCAPSVVNSKVLKQWCAHLDYYSDKATWDQAASWLAGLFTKPTKKAPSQAAPEPNTNNGFASSYIGTTSTQYNQGNDLALKNIKIISATRITGTSHCEDGLTCESNLLGFIDSNNKIIMQTQDNGPSSGWGLLFTGTIGGNNISGTYINGGGDVGTWNVNKKDNNAYSGPIFNQTANQSGTGYYTIYRWNEVTEMEAQVKFADSSEYRTAIGTVTNNQFVLTTYLEGGTTRTMTGSVNGNTLSGIYTTSDNSSSGTFTTNINN